MKNLLPFVLSAFSFTLAGPVGDYLGLSVGLVTTDSGWGRDSFHFYLPTPSDSVAERTFIDTTTVLAETTLQGNPAWIARTVVVSDSGRNARTDTLYESGDTLLRSRMDFLGISLWASVYRIPFQVGSQWETGAAGTYYLDLNGDSLIDTVTVWGDTVKVVGIEDVTVPYGTVRDCYKLDGTTYQSLAMTYEGIPIRETTFVRHFEWYKDSLTRVKDSTVITARAYVRILIWLRAADVFITNLTRLTDCYVGISEPAPATPMRLRAGPNPFAASVRVSVPEPEPAAREGPLRIYDSSGRLVRTLDLAGTAGTRSAVWDGKDAHGRAAPGGVYHARCGPGSIVIIRFR